jgi:thermitase
MRISGRFRRNRGRLLCVVAFVLLAASTGMAQSRVMPSEILVKFKAGVSGDEIAASHAQYRVTVIEYLEALQLYRLRIPPDRSIDDMLELYRTDDRVEYAEPNYMGRGGDFVPDDTFFPLQWYLNNTGQSAGRPGADIKAVDGWQVTEGNSSVIVAVLDTGIDFASPEFAGRILPGFDFVNNDDDPSADNPHGVEVAGILAAASNNHFGIAGIAPRVSLLPVKVLNAANLGATTTLAQGLIFAADHGARVISMSLINYPTNSAVLNSALQYARDAGAVLVACAGNGGLGNADVSGPGASPLTISVGATDRSDLRAAFSGTGAALDVVAPGVLLPTINGPTESVVTFSGCSAATPVVAGIAALLVSLDPTLTHDDVQQILQDTADDLVGAAAEDTPGRDDFFGYGRVNMNRAITAAITASLNSDVSFETLEDTFTSIADPTGCPSGSAGRFRFEARLANISTTTLSNLSVRVSMLTNGNLLRLPNDRTGAAGARLVLENTGDLTNGTLAPGGRIQVPFEICMRQLEPFQLFVDVKGAERQSNGED